MERKEEKEEETKKANNLTFVMYNRYMLLDLVLNRNLGIYVLSYV